MQDATGIAQKSDVGRACSACGQIKSMEEFFFQLKRFTRDYKCYPCRLALIAAKNRHYPNKRRALVNSIKESPCHDCGGTFPPCAMDFDHRDAKGKSSCVGSMVSRNFPIETIMDEIAKCDLVCANCHRIRTHAKKKSRLP